MRKEGKTWLAIKECAHKKKWLKKGQEVERIAYVKHRLGRKKPIEKYCLKTLEGEEKIIYELLLS